VGVDALRVCFLTDEERKSLSEGGAVGYGAVGANAGVGEGVLASQRQGRSS
jgi:hypothetical protein